MAMAHKMLYENEDVLIDDLTSDIVVKDGALTINGNVANGVKITLTNTSGKISGKGLQICGGFGGGICSIRMAGSYVQAGSITQIGARSIYEHGVNIDGRIITSGCVVAVDDKYTVTYARDDESRQVGVVVDGKAYNGTKIIIHGSEVTVLDQGQADESQGQANESQGASSVERCKRQLIITGRVAEGVTINCDYPITIKGEIGSRVTIVGGDTVTCESVTDSHLNATAQGKLMLKEVRDDSHLSSVKDAITVGLCGNRNTLTANNKITVNTLGKGCVARSHMDGLTCELMDDDVQVNTRANIIVKTVGDNCNLESTMNSVACGLVGASCRLQARDNIRVIDTIGEHTTLFSIMDSCEFDRLADGCSVNARANIIGREVGQNCQLACAMGYAQLTTVGKGTHVNTRELATVGTCDDNVHVNSLMNEVRVVMAGMYCHINARQDARINTLGSHSHVVSIMGSIDITNCDADCHLNARESVRARPASGVRATSIYATGRSVTKA